MANAIVNCELGDIFIVYWGGHGSVIDKQFHLKTNCDQIGSYMLLRMLQYSKAELLIITDACYSGQMITDFGLHKPVFIIPATLICSTQYDNQAMTGWRLVQLLIDYTFQKNVFLTPQNLADYVSDNLVTNWPSQRAIVFKKM